MIVLDSITHVQPAHRGRVVLAGYGSIRTIASNWSDRRYHLAVCFAEVVQAERRLVLRDPGEQTIQATSETYEKEDSCPDGASLSHR